MQWITDVQQATEQQITDWAQNGNPEWGDMQQVELELIVYPDGRHRAIFTLQKMIYGDWKYRDTLVTVRREYEVTR